MDWYDLVDKMEKFLYVDFTESLIAHRDSEKKYNYLLNPNDVINIFRNLKEIEIRQNGYTDEQLKKLNELKKYFFSLETSNNNVREVYFQMKNLYEGV